MKRKLKKEISEDSAALLYFLSIYSSGKLMLCKKFGYSSTASIDRWFNRGFPVRIRQTIHDYLQFMTTEEKVQDARTKTIHKRLATVWG